ncbi:MAG: adenylate kinase, partial [Candidatus Nanohalobium sp.]
PVDVCVVLRTRPDKLRERLNERDYSDRKVEENVQSEILDVVLSEAVENQETVVEVDTTEKSAEEVFEEVKEKVGKGENDYGNFDWTEYL